MSNKNNIFVIKILFYIFQLMLYNRFENLKFLERRNENEKIINYYFNVYGIFSWVWESKNS